MTWYPRDLADARSETAAGPNKSAGVSRRKSANRPSLAAYVRRPTERSNPTRRNRGRPICQRTIRRQNIAGSRCIG